MKGLIENLTGQYLDRIRLGGRLRTPGRIRTECGELPARQGEEIGGRKWRRHNAMWKKVDWYKRVNVSSNKLELLPEHL